MPTTAMAPTFAARKPRCSNRSRARRDNRASSRRSRRASACTASQRPSTTPRRWPRCRGSCSTAGRPFLNSANPTTAAPSCFPSPATLTSQATTKCRSARLLLHPVGLNLGKNVLGLVLIAPTLLLLGEPLAPAVPASATGLLLLSGVLGIAVSDTLFFSALNRLG